MAISLTNYPRVPVYHVADAAALAALTSMQEGDLCSQDDTKVLYRYDGAAWNNVLAGITENPVLLNETTLADDNTESYSLTDIASGYKAFKIQFIIKMVTTVEQILLRLNNDSGANYSYSWLYNNNGAAAAGYSTGQTGIIMNYGVNAQTGDFSTYDIDISNSSTVTKGINVHMSAPSANIGCGIISSIYSSATEISRIDLLSNTGGRKWKTGTKIRIWGLK